LRPYIFGMDAPLHNGISVPKWLYLQATKRKRRVRDEHYDGRFGHCKQPSASRFDAWTSLVHFEMVLFCAVPDSRWAIRAGVAPLLKTDFSSA
jgi:hypothetical protein